MPTDARLTDPWKLGPLEVPNRVLLAPLAGIGNWFVRLQAKRFGAGMAVSEMVSSYAIHYRNEKTCTEMLRIDPRERQPGPDAPEGPSPSSCSARTRTSCAPPPLAWPRPEPTRSTSTWAAPCRRSPRPAPAPRCSADPDRAVAIARATVDGANGGGGARAIPVTVKLRSGLRPGDESGFALAHRLVEEAGVAAIAFHPRSAAVQHKGRPDYELAARLVESLPAPVILTGGMDDADSVREAFASTGATAVMLARGALGNPWLFEQLVRGRELGPSGEEVLVELRWTIDCAVEHLGEPRATRYLRKFYPWYLARLGLAAGETRHLQESLQSAPTLERVQSVLEVDVGELAPAL